MGLIAVLCNFLKIFYPCSRFCDLQNLFDVTKLGFDYKSKNQIIAMTAFTPILANFGNKRGFNFQ